MFIKIIFLNNENIVIYIDMCIGIYDAILLMFFVLGLYLRFLVLKVLYVFRFGVVFVIYYIYNII